MKTPRVSKHMIKKFGPPQHEKPRDYKYGGYAMASEVDKRDPWGGGLSICLWCGHFHSTFQGGILKPSYHYEGCPAVDVLV